MKQILQNLNDGTTEVVDVPCPRAGRGGLLIRTHCSLVSAGTERMLVEFGKAGLIEKARQQPDKVRMVLDKVRTDGLLPTLEAVRGKLDQPMPMGYSNVGTVIEVGVGVTGFTPGDRVVSNGRHAEVVAVPVNLCAKIPGNVGNDVASFTVLAAIGLQGLRLAKPTLGECIAVSGLGLIGLVTVQMLRANGCRVLGLDYDKTRLAMAREMGAEVVDLGIGVDPVAAAMEFSRGRGVDAVIITAATRSSEPVHQAAMMSRKRGRIVLVGVTGLELSRADFYEKELSFQVSCSYGPGRYDPQYEEGGIDYPVGFVRWTEQRNFEAALDMLSMGSLNVSRLISHRFPLSRAGEAYEVVGGSEPSLGILLEYPDGAGGLEDRRLRTVELPTSRDLVARSENRGPGVSVIGAGNYAGAVLLPAFRDAKVSFRMLAGTGNPGISRLGRKFGFAAVTTDDAALLADPATGMVVIATRHDSHARYVVAALKSGKHVFVEKPLCLNREELKEILSAATADRAGCLMVGFNRRFAPHIRRIKQLLPVVPGPKTFVMTVNAGSIPTSHWTQNPAVGGGRLLGEGCHFVDLLRHLAASPVSSLQVSCMAGGNSDTASILLRFEDGSMGAVHYLANGSRAFPKERLEIFASGSVLQLDNFRKLRGFGWPKFGSMSLWRQDKGQRDCVQAFVDAVRSGEESPISLAELAEVSELSIQIQEAVS